MNLKKLHTFQTIVKCTAVTTCGKVYLMEVNSKDNFYPRYGESETAIIEHNQDSLIGTAAIAPQGCTLAIGFEKEKIFLKSQDEPITKIVFYPVMKESDYEVLHEDFILKKC